MFPRLIWDWSSISGPGWEGFAVLGEKDCQFHQCAAMALESLEIRAE